MKFIIEFLKKLLEFLKETKEELSRVSWLNRRQTLKYTIIVIALSLILAIFFGGFDYFINYLLSKIINK